MHSKPIVTYTLDPLRSNALGELTDSRQNRPIEDYLERIQMLLSHTCSLQSKQQVDLFTSGLIEPLSVDFELQAPQYLVIAMRLQEPLIRKNKGT